MQNHTQKIYDLITKFDTAMLVSHGRDAKHHARPMGIVKVEPNCDVWFFTGRDTEKTRELQNDSDVLLVFQKGHTCSISLLGRAALISDRAQIAALWKESYKVWFPEGINDPNLILIKVSASEAEFWDSTGFKSVKYLFETAKAYVTHTTPKIDPDQHGHVALK